MRGRRHWMPEAWAVAGLATLAALKMWALITPVRGSRLHLGGDFGLAVEGYFYHELKRGSLPLWDPTLGTGSPFLGGGTHHPMFVQAHLHLFYPLNLLWLGLLERDQFIPHVALQYHHALHYALAGVFTYAYARLLGVVPGAAAVAGIAFMLSGFLLGHVQHWTLVDTLVWLPAVLACLLRAEQTGRLRWGALAGVALASACLAGHPQIFYYIGLATVAFVATLLARRAAAGRPCLPLALNAGLAVLVAGGLSAVQLVPSWEVALGSHRAGLGYDWKALGSLPPAYLLQLLMPWGLTSLTGWRDRVSEYYLYPGILTVALGGLALARRWDWRVGFHAVLGTAALLLALGDHYGLYRPAYDLLPGLRLFRVPARSLALVSFALAVLAGLGAHALLREAGGDSLARTLRRLSLVAVAGLLPLPLLLVLTRKHPDADDIHNLAGQYVLLALLLLAVTAVVGWARQVGTVAAGAGLVGLLVLDLLLGSYPVTPSSRDPDVRSPTEDAWVAAIQRAGEPVRLVRQRRIRPATLYRHGWGVVDGESTFAPPAFLDLYALSREHPRLLDLLNVRYFLPNGTDPPVLPAAAGPLRVWPGAVRRLPLPAGGPATRLTLETHLSRGLDVPHGDRVATVHLVAADGTAAAIPLRAGIETAEWSIDRAGSRAGHARAAIARSWRTRDGVEGHSYGAVVPLGREPRPVEIVLEGAPGRAVLVVERLAVDDAPVPLAEPDAGRFRAVVPGLFENLRALPRAFLVPRARQVAPDELLEQLKDLDPAEEALVTEPVPPAWTAGPRGAARPLPPVRVLEHAPHRVRLEAEIAEPRVLVLSDTFDPRWRAWDNGRPVPVLRADHALRAVLLGPGRHLVEFRYRQPSAWVGLGITLVTAGLLGAAGLVLARRRRPA